MKKIIPADIGTPIVDPNGHALQHFYNLIQSISRLEILDGTGSPEGVVTAQLKRMYLNTATAKLYIKTTDGGNTGWVALN